MTDLIKEPNQSILDPSSNFSNENKTYFSFMLPKKKDPYVVEIYSEGSSSYDVFFNFIKNWSKSQRCLHELSGLS